MSHLLDSSTDFSEEKTDLEQLCAEVSCLSASSSAILFTPKFYCELAGEGIEYLWGALKRIYRRHPITDKRSVVNFERLVKESLTQVSLDICRRFSAKARGYMLTYKHK